MWPYLANTNKSEHCEQKNSSSKRRNRVCSAHGPSSINGPIEYQQLQYITHIYALSSTTSGDVNAAFTPGDVAVTPATCERSFLKPRVSINRCSRSPDWLSRGLTSHSTLYRSFRGRTRSPGTDSNLGWGPGPLTFCMTSLLDFMYISKRTVFLKLSKNRRCNSRGTRDSHLFLNTGT